MNPINSSWIDLDYLVGRLQSTPVPDANLPLRTTLLHADPLSRASCMLVEFPIGWKRAAGMYSCAEHAVVIDGELILDGDLWTKNQGFVVPADRARTETCAPGGALAVAWFGGAPKWTSAATQRQLTPSSEFWVGDSPDGTYDELNSVGRKWRHCDEPQSDVREQPKSGVFMYRWPTP
jgi:hypothetical protein